jgi:hypothetical protein
MHKFAPLIHSYMLAPTCFSSSLPKHVGAIIYEWSNGAKLCIVLVISTTSDNARYEC